jgi:hypothetical protein
LGKIGPQEAMMKRRDFIRSGAGAAVLLAMAGARPVGAAAASPGALSASAFEPLVGQDFRVYSTSRGVVLRLIRVATIPPAPASGPLHQFQLYFTGRAMDRFPSGSYEMENPALGRLPIFLQPASDPSSAIAMYRADFSLLS